MEINIINNSNINLLQDFLKNKLSTNFRYFDKRNINVIFNHYVRIMIKNKSIAYGQFDFDNDTYWLGIYIWKKYYGFFNR